MRFRRRTGESVSSIERPGSSGTDVEPVPISAERRVTVLARAARDQSNAVAALAALAFLLFAAGTGIGTFRTRIDASRVAELAEFRRWECVRSAAIDLAEPGVAYRVVVPDDDYYLSQRTISSIFPDVLLNAEAPGAIVLGRVGGVDGNLGRVCADLTVTIEAK